MSSKKYENILADLIKIVRERRDLITVEELGKKFREMMHPNDGAYKELTDQQLGQNLISQRSEFGEKIRWQKQEYHEGEV